MYDIDKIETIQIVEDAETPFNYTVIMKGHGLSQTRTFHHTDILEIVGECAERNIPISTEDIWGRVETFTSIVDVKRWLDL